MARFFTGLICALGLMTCSTLLAKNEEAREFYNNNFGLNFSMSASGHYYDNDGNVVQDIDVNGFGKDTTAYLKFDYSEITIEPFYERYFFDRLRLRAAVPITFHKLKQTLFVSTLVPANNPVFPNDSVEITNRYESPDKNLTRINYISLLAEFNLYKPSSRNFNASAGFDLRIPTGFNEGAPNDPETDFLDDYYIEAIPFISGVINGEVIRSYLRAAYIYRAENMTDQVNLYGKFGIESIPNAILYFQADFAKTVEASIDKDFDIFRRPNNEDYLLIGFGLDFAYERIFFNINYNLPMWGRNNWKTSIFNLTAGFSL